LNDRKRHRYENNSAKQSNSNNEIPGLNDEDNKTQLTTVFEQITDEEGTFV